MKSFIAFLMLCSLVACTSSPHAETRTYSTVSESFDDPVLDQMLAPIALYPDTVLSHILIASTYPLEVVQAHRWSKANNHLEGEAAVSAAENEDWEPSVKALVAFPQVLERMSDDLAWTQQLGDAFLDDEARVMDSIQNLRSKAWASGSLDKLSHVHVQREKEVIIIEPAVERVVYVPTYDTRVVYGNWWWPDYPPVYWHYPHYTYVSGFYWGPAIYIGSSFYFSSFHWPRRQVVYVSPHHYRSRPHFHSGRSIAHYRGAQHWRHNPDHRRGVAYRNNNTRQQFNSNRPTTHERYQQRFERGNLSSAERAQRPNTRVYQGQSANNGRNQRPDADRVRERLQQRPAGGNSPAHQNARPRPQGDISPGQRTRPAENVRPDNPRSGSFTTSNPERRNQRREATPRENTVRTPTPPASATPPVEPRQSRGNVQQRTFSNGGSGHRAAPASGVQRESRIHRPAAEARGNRSNNNRQSR